MTPRPFVSASALILSVLLTAAPLVAGGLDEEPRPRLRVENLHMRALVDAGLAQSPSFRALVDELERTDVVVYVKFGRLPSRLDGQLTFVSAAGGLRYVVVQLAWDRSPQRKIATLGHELQHALEIAAIPAIVDQPSLLREYARIGFEREPTIELTSRVDTLEAIKAGEQIWKELVGGASAD